MTATEHESLKSKLLELAPPEGERVSNKSLIEEFIGLDEPGMPAEEDVRRALYWDLRNELIDSGDLEKGKGQGGSVRRAPKPLATDEDATPMEAENVEAVTTEEETPLEKESDLYDPFIRAIKAGYIAEFKTPRDHLLVKTAHAGSRNTGGKWTRPDVALVAVHSYPFLPNKSLELTTYEIKKNIYDAMEGVFEALAHSAFAHRTYLVVKAEGAIPADLADTWARVREECDRLAIGLIKFSKADEYETFDFISEAAPNEPDLFKLNKFIAEQINHTDQEIIREWVR